MNDYIQREDALNAVFTTTSKRIINAIPAADVEPVAHARWSGVIEQGGEAVVRCTNCLNPISAFYKTQYCARCGARMDGDAHA